MERTATLRTHWPWMVAALAAQTSWGAYPVLARYLQTVSRLPSMSILALGNGVALLLVTLLLWSRIEWRTLRTPLLLLFALIVVGRGVTNFLAARFTLSIYVQLITQLTPFLVALLSTAVFHEALPRYTGRALILCLLGAVLMMSGNIGVAVGSGIGRNDWLGIGLAAFSSLLLASYMLIVRRSSDANVHIPGETLWLVQLFSLSFASGVISLLVGEDLGRWTTLAPFDWLIFAAIVLGVFVGANAGQISAIRHLGAPMVSSILSWRLVSALVLAAILLGERLTSRWQVVGAALVLLTITWYLWQQR